MSEYSPLAELQDSHVIDFEPHCEYYVVGDVHGCLDEYKALYKLLDMDATRNGKYLRVIQLGDIIDRGPYFKEMFLEDYASYRIMGNHEYNFLMEHLGYKECRSEARRRNLDLMKSLPEDEQRGILFEITQRPAYMTLNAYGTQFVFSHAPIQDIESGIYNVWRQGIGSLPDYCMRSTDVDMDKLRRNIAGSVTFFHGHQSWSYRTIEDQIAEQRQNMVRLFNVDSRCVYGGHLVAVRLRDNHVISVKSKVCVDK
ncbi:hypothetical protein pf16_127 [Pseudomonas phage pf16]|uniref:Calcineurin-like phosphoesterase domain-containing protein n=1 Tax=Pseudomonas phage pf16 TaxID=1815630 RepID=A0A1S5R635_9CAUD|nr:NinI-like serine-threonine phosphatase [Pseudomonas phage pf16]AND75050.1 hypothetical protein pf16_127 [Pseudomonas phage pf16]